MFFSENIGNTWPGIPQSPKSLEELLCHKEYVKAGNKEACRVVVHSASEAMFRMQRRGIPIAEATVAVGLYHAGTLRNTVESQERAMRPKSFRQTTFQNLREP